ncbi:MAG: hypothetical protein K0Q91_1124 [Fibrobacteria bacterium]|nr:hypothetical protein [Fibrobacteria bacterium]
MPKGGASLESFRNDSTVKSVNVTELNRTALDGERAEFNPSSAEKKVLRFMESRRVEGSGKEIRHGIVEGVPGSAVTLFIRETYVRGFVRAGSSLYVIEPLGDGLYSVVHYDAGKFPKEF